MCFHPKLVEHQCGFLHQVQWSTFFNFNFFPLWLRHSQVARQVAMFCKCIRDSKLLEVCNLQTVRWYIKLGLRIMPLFWFIVGFFPSWYNHLKIFCWLDYNFWTSW
jgi:hypothetical protein